MSSIGRNRTRRLYHPENSVLDTSYLLPDSEIFLVDLGNATGSLLDLGFDGSRSQEYI